MFAKGRHKYPEKCIIAFFYWHCRVKIQRSHYVSNSVGSYSEVSNHIIDAIESKLRDANNAVKHRGVPDFNESALSGVTDTVMS
jgi:hypothetical protein